LKQQQLSNRILQQLLKHVLPYETLTTQTENKTVQKFNPLVPLKKLDYTLPANNDHCYHVWQN